MHFLANILFYIFNFPPTSGPAGIVPLKKYVLSSPIMCCVLYNLCYYVAFFSYFFTFIFVFFFVRLLFLDIITLNRLNTSCWKIFNIFWKRKKINHFCFNNSFSVYISFSWINIKLLSVFDLKRSSISLLSSCNLKILFLYTRSIVEKVTIWQFKKMYCTNIFKFLLIWKSRDFLLHPKYF